MCPVFDFFVNHITDWLMVIITAIYVVFTIRICNANYKSAEAARKQIEVAERQFYETQRIDALPCFSVSIGASPSACYCMQMDITQYLNGPAVAFLKRLDFSNIGNGIAKNIHVFFMMDDLDAVEIMSIPMLPVDRDGQETINMAFAADRNAAAIKKNILKGKITVQFEDLMDRKYEQVIMVEFIFNDNEHEAPALLEKSVFAPKLITDKGFSCV